MKKIISLLIVASILLTMCCLTAFAEEPGTTSGPYEGTNMISGGARVGFSNLNSPQNVYIVSNDGEDIKIDNEAMSGATYDRASNTLTIKDLDAGDWSLFIWYMGDDFKLKVEGSCAVGIIYVNNLFNTYSTSLNIIGTGTLDINGNKENDLAVSMYSEGDKSAMKLNIAGTVTVNAYAKKAESEDKATVISIRGSGYDTDAKAASAGGKAIEGIKSERQKHTIYDTVNTAMPYKWYSPAQSGIIAKSKTDPDGVYSASMEYDDDKNIVSYYVKRYIYIADYNLYTNDISYGDDKYAFGKTFSPEEFDKEFTTVPSEQPREILFTSEWREKNLKGNEGVQLKKSDDPEGVYVGSPAGISGEYSYDNPQGYYIYRVVWDDSEGMYVKDTSFKTVDVKTSELGEKGYSYVTESVEEKQMLHIWVMPAPYVEDDPDYENWDDDYEMLRRESDPDGIYVRTGTYYTEGENGERLNPGIMVDKVFYDEENEVYYTNTFGHDPEVNFSIPDENMESGDTEFSYITQTVEKRVRLRYLPESYEFWQYARTGTELRKKIDEKTIDEDTVYAYTTVTHDHDGAEEKLHDVYQLEYNEADGHYWVVSDGYENPIEEDLTDEELNAGYKVITDPKPAIFYTDGSVSCGESRLYLDDSGNQYVTDADKVYKVEDKTVKNGDTDYHILTEAPDVSKDSLKSDEREEYLDLWNYTLEGEEYHFTGSGVPAAGAAVKGTITSFLDEEGEISVALYKGDEVVKTAKVKGNTAGYALEDVPAGEYSFENVPDGEYVLHVEKANHVSRDYAVSVKGDDVTMDANLCPLGDITGDGKTNVQDCTAILRYVRKLDTDLSDYMLSCADVTGDGKVNVQDVTRILRHVRRIEELY